VGSIDSILRHMIVLTRNYFSIYTLWVIPFHQGVWSIVAGFCLIHLKMISVMSIRKVSGIFSGKEFLLKYLEVLWHLLLSMARQAACSFRRKRSWIIYCWLVWCEKNTVPAYNPRSYTSKRTGRLWPALFSPTHLSLADG